MSREEYQAQVARICAVLGIVEANLRCDLVVGLKGDASIRRILDVGCGPGVMVPALRAVCPTAQLLCLDLDRDALQACDGTWHLQADACALPLSDGSVDASLCAGVLHSVSDPRRLFSELARVTRRGGQVMIASKGVAPWASPQWAARVVAVLGPDAALFPPLDLLPAALTPVALDWIGGDAFWVLVCRQTGEVRGFRHDLVSVFVSVFVLVFA